MPRKTDSNNPADFLDRYPGFDLEDPDWPDLRAKLEQVASLLAIVPARRISQKVISSTMPLCVS